MKKSVLAFTAVFALVKGPVQIGIGFIVGDPFVLAQVAVGHVVV